MFRHRESDSGRIPRSGSRQFPLLPILELGTMRTIPQTTTEHLIATVDNLRTAGLLADSLCVHFRFPFRIVLTGKDQFQIKCKANAPEKPIVLRTAAKFWIDGFTSQNAKD